LRTARQGLRANPVNPLQSAFTKKNASGVLNLYRTYAVFERSKPHVNIGTIGHVDHGKVRHGHPSSFSPQISVSG
jgi:elongation factor Tu